MKSPKLYLNQMICKILIDDYTQLSEAMEKNPFSSYEAKAPIPLSEDLPEKMIYDYLAVSIARSINPFAVVSHSCLERSIKAYEKIIPLIKDKEVKVLANHHLASAKNSLANLEKISMVNTVNERFNLRK